LQKFSQKKIFPHLVNLVNNLLFFSGSMVKHRWFHLHSRRRYI